MLDEEKLNTLQADSIEDLSSVLSNTNISGLGNRSDKTFTIRGISNYLTYESSVAMYIDDTPVPFSYGYGALDFKNIKSIEVLKGPQGTQFGKGAASGAINIYTKEPTNKFTNEVSLGYSSYNSKDIYARVSGPLNNKDLSFGASITKSTSDGYTKSETTNSSYDYKDFTGFSAKLHYKPSSPLSVTLNYSKTIVDDGGATLKINTKNNIRSIEEESLNDYVRMDNDLASLKVKYNEDDYTFTSVSTYAKESVTKNLYLSSVLGGTTLYNDATIEEITQELRLNYYFENADFLLGAFYSDKLKFDYVEKQLNTGINPNGLNSLQNPDENIALFTQYKYYINDNYSIMAGIRYQETRRKFNRSANALADATTNHNDGSITFRNFLPTLSISYLGDDNSNTYLTYSKGYLPGGYNYRTSANLVLYKSQIVDSFELGYKRKYNSSFSFNSAVFYNLIKDLRINTLNNLLVSTTKNAEKAHSYGIEFDASYKKNDFSLFTSIGYTQTNVDEFISDRTYEGNKMIEVPDITASLGLKYNIVKNYHVQSDIKYMGERYYNISNTAKESGYVTTNLGFGYTKDDLKVLVYANNLFDKKYTDFRMYTENTPGGPSNNYYHFGNPRVIGLSISNSF